MTVAWLQKDPLTVMRVLNNLNNSKTKGPCKQYYLTFVTLSNVEVHFEKEEKNILQQTCNDFDRTMTL